MQHTTYEYYVVVQFCPWFNSYFLNVFVHGNVW